VSELNKTIFVQIHKLFTSSRYIDDNFFKLLSSVFLVVTVFARLAKLAADGHDDALGLKDLDGHEHRHLEKKQIVLIWFLIFGIIVHFNLD
jgi:hypothetical protein